MLGLVFLGRGQGSDRVGLEFRVRGLQTFWEYDVLRDRFLGHRCSCCNLPGVCLLPKRLLGVCCVLWGGL